MTKADRIRAAQIAAVERVGKRAISLTIAVLRAKILRESLQPFLDRLAVSGRTDADLRAEAADSALRLEQTDASRLDSLYAFYLGALYSVVEKWRQWAFTDRAVDTLLADDSRVRLLEGHRNAIFHADHYDHNDVVALAERHDMIPWADELLAALGHFFAGWHADPNRHVTEHLERTGA